MKAVASKPLTRLQDDMITPSDYLEFARADFRQKDLRGNVNALSNIKRAIESQLDVILEIYGLLELSETRRWHFPHKVSLINKTGLVSPNVLNKINQKRNELEHYHKIPSPEEVQDYMDIAELFLEVFRNNLEAISYYQNEKLKIAFRMDNDKGELCLFTDENIYNAILTEEMKPDLIITTNDIDEWIRHCALYVTPALRGIGT